MEVALRRSGLALRVTASFLLIAIGCGSATRQLQTINISPAVAEGQVQFVATGHYSQDPVTMSPLPVLWGFYLPQGKSGATITQSGVAQCESGMSGTFSVAAWAPADPSIPIAQLGTAKKAVVGIAVLNCP